MTSYRDLHERGRVPSFQRRDLLPGDRIKSLRDHYGVEFDKAWKIGMSPVAYSSFLSQYQTTPPSKRESLASAILNRPRRVV